MSETEAKKPTLAAALAEAARLDPERFRRCGSNYAVWLEGDWLSLGSHSERLAIAAIQAAVQAAIESREGWTCGTYCSTSKRWDGWVQRVYPFRSFAALSATPALALLLAFNEALRAEQRAQDEARLKESRVPWPGATPQVQAERIRLETEVLKAVGSTAFDPTVRFPDLEAQVPAAEEALKAEQGKAEQAQPIAAGEQFLSSKDVQEGKPRWRSRDDVTVDIQKARYEQCLAVCKNAEEVVAALGKQVTALSLLANGLSGRLDREWSQLQRISRDLGKRVEALTLQAEHWGMSVEALEERVEAIWAHLTPNIPPGVSGCLRPIVTGFTKVPPKPDPPTGGSTPLTTGKRRWDHSLVGKHCPDCCGEITRRPDGLVGGECDCEAE